jgi:hypothetical protein
MELTLTLEHNLFTHRAQTELGLERTVALESTIERTAAWHRAGAYDGSR